ncbi:MAG: hypothetical protein Q4E45_08970 [Eubacteriales bacterium]|nr:hypothetical protein [Eubacteriales bacterium]
MDNADMLLGTYDKQPEGTAMTAGYAKNKGTPVKTILPTLCVFYGTATALKDKKKDNDIPAGHHILTGFLFLEL